MNYVTVGPTTLQPKRVEVGVGNNPHAGQSHLGCIVPSTV
jgi:hypothetical protein